MPPCVTHLYTGPLPCPWPSCPTGTFHDSFEYLDRQITRESFPGEDGTIVYGWAIENTASPLLLTQFARRSILRVNADNLFDDDGHLYHFTSAEGLRGIVSSGELWLTDYRDFPDKEEISNGLRVAHHVVADCHFRMHPITYELLQAVFEEPLDAPIYVACFCWLSESPYHWQEYARDETGGAIVLETDRLGAAS